VSLQVPCGVCGERPVEEFLYGGERWIPPEGLIPEALAVDEAWMRTNPDGVVEERWFHLGGCRRWTELRRHAGSDTFIDEDG